jgi:hypothetical protein
VTWCIPPEHNAAFVAQMEQVLDVYVRAYDPVFPVVCMDEQPKQLLSETRTPLGCSRKHPRRVDHEYERHGTCCVWMFVEPLGGWRDVRASLRRTSIDWACQVQSLVDHPRYAKAKRITLVCDNLNTHKLASLYEAFEPAEAFRIAKRIEIVYTPVHGSWLNIAEIELSALTRMCLDRRIDTIEEIVSEASAWSKDRNTAQVGVNWHFNTDNARIKLKHLYPEIKL